MAVVRARTSPPYALIIFVILWVISTGLAIYLFTQQSKLQQDAATARTDLDKYVLPRERAEAQRFIELGSKAGAKSSAFAEATRQINDLKAAIAGNSSQSTDAILNDANSERNGTALVTLVKTLSASVETAKGQLEAAKKELADANALNDTQRTKFEDARKKVEESISARQGEIAKVNEELSAAQAQIVTLKKDLEKANTDHAAEMDKVVRGNSVKEAQAAAKIQELQNIIANLRLIIDGLRPRSGSKVAAVAAGNVLRSDPVANEVYIGLGRADRVVPGLTFSVHDPRIGIVTEGAGTKGKGGIEILEVGERESRARVTHLEKGQRIQPGDILFNPVWSTDKTRKLHFVVYGDFDIDGDGQATSLEREKLVRMIKDWGGEIDDIKTVEETNKEGKTEKMASLDPQTDYLVLGTSPRVPSGVKPEDLDAASKDVFSAQVAKSKEYDRIESEAKRSSVPILNANRFLSMIGYYNTTLIRR